MNTLPRSQGLVPGLVGMILLELACVGMFSFVTLSAWGTQRWEVIPFLALVVFVAATTLRSITSRVKTLSSVSSGRLSVVKTLSLTEGFLDLGEIAPHAALQRCFDAMNQESGYESRSKVDGTVRGTLKQTLARKHPLCFVTEVDGRLQIRFELEEGGAIWADGGRMEREIGRLGSSVLANGRA